MPAQRSNEDQAVRISKSIFVTNFPDNLGSKELWKALTLGLYDFLMTYNDFVSDDVLFGVDIEGLLVIEDNLAPLLLESVYTSDDESKHGARILNDGAQNSDVESDDECNVDGVSETVFSDNVDECNVDGHGKETDKQQSEDPFGFYDLLNKLPVKGVRDESTSLSHPPGFTPKTSVTHANVGEICEDGPTNGEDMVNMPRVDAKVMDHSQEVHDSSNGESVSSFSHKVHNGGSILDILDDMVRVGHSMGLGHKTKKEWVKELNYKHRINFLALQETKMDCISHMDVKSLWGNSNFDFVASDSLGNSGGILCIWEASIFKKDGATISDNFIAIYGTVYLIIVKIILVAVYAPQQPGS
ncbi:hypothetical protein Tco_0139180 [Tanacetum coccineum]